MNTAALNSSEALPAPNGLLARLLNVLVTPSEIFEEVSTSPFRVLNWLVPMAMVCITGLALLGVMTTKEQTAATVGQWLDAGSITAAQGDLIKSHWVEVSRFATCVGTIAGTFWSAFVLWFIGRVILKTCVPFWKALEVVGLTSVIIALGNVVTALLVGAMAEPSARPALSLLALKLEPDNPIRMLFGTVDLFHLWATGTLAIGLAKLSGVSFKESAFWVFGYWFVAKVTLIILG